VVAGRARVQAVYILKIFSRERGDPYEICCAKVCTVKSIFNILAK
jgi:hypothetical protein